MHSRIALRWVFKILMLAMLFSLALARPVEASPLRNDAAQLFYLKLAPYGTWVRHRIYGRVWFPRKVPEDWRPYQDGYWAYTHDYGWLWVSDWAWGWATDHYGRWVWDDWYGWIWVPGAVWSPAWVVWRYGEGYVSWAPMPIQYVWNPYAGYTNEYFDFDRYIFWDCWVTTHEHDFPRRNQPRKFLPPQMNREILPRTRYADPLVVRDKRIVNRGIPWQRIEQVTGSPFSPVVPTVVLDPDDHKASGRRPKSREDILIYRPIDNQPTVETIRDEAALDKALAEKINLNRQLLSDRNRVAGESPEHRRPGRLSGRPKPLDDDQGTENPLTMPPEMQQTAPAFLTLPTIPPAVREAPLKQHDQRDIGPGRLRSHGLEDVNDQPAPIDYMQQNMPQEPESEASGRTRRDLERQQQAEQEAIRQQQESARQQQIDTERQQQQLERQQQAEQERTQQEAIRQQQESTRQQQESTRQQQFEAERQQRQLEQQQQAEQERTQQEAIRQQQESARQQQFEAERQQRQLEQQQQAEQERMQQETIRQQQESVRQQQIETERQQRQLEQQQQAEQERMQQEAIRQQQESARQQQVEAERQQRQMEQQQQAEQERIQQEAIRQQDEMARQQQLEVERQQQQLERQQAEQERMQQEAIREQQQQAIQQQQMQMRQQETVEQAAPRGDGRGRGGRGFGRGRD